VVVAGIAACALAVVANGQETTTTPSAPTITYTHPATVLSLVRTIDTWRWSPPSPDPAGLTYRPAYFSSGVSVPAGILVSDSEVDEMVGLYTGKNLFITQPDGTLAGVGTLAGFSVEPSAVAWDPSARVLYVSDDDQDKIFRINPQDDGLIGTADDTVSTVCTTSVLGSNDPEGIDYDPGTGPGTSSLWLADGDGSTIYNFVRDATGNCVTPPLRRWASTKVGMRDPEGIEFDPATGHLFIADRLSHLVAEATKDGDLVALYDLSGSALMDASGITLAPASSGSGTNIFVSDRGVDNDADPTENDGRIFEFARIVVDADVAPIAANPGIQFNIEGDSVSLQIVAFEPNGDPIAYSATDLPDGLSIDPVTGLISGSVSFTAAAGSPYSVTVIADDGDLSDSETFTWRVTDGNGPPVIQGVPDQTNVEGDLVSLQIQASDPDDDPLTYSATGLPPALAIDTITGLISGSIAVGASEASPYSVELKVIDPGNLSDRKTVRWGVTAVPPNGLPVVQNPGPQSHTEGDTVNLQVQASDPEGDPLAYSANNLPPGLAIEAGTGLIAGTVAAGAAAASPYSVQVSASDGGSTDTESFLWSISATPNQPPVLQTPADQTSTEGDLVTLQIQASDPDGGPIAYSAGNLPPGLSIDTGTGLIAGTVASGATAASPYSVQVSASDGQETATAVFTWTVIAPPVAPAMPAGLQIAGDTRALHLDWADNTEIDLAGYNIYRSDGVGPYARLTPGPVGQSTFSDAEAPAGVASHYHVTAVNLAGIESAPAAASALRSRIVFRAVTTARDSTTGGKAKTPILSIANPAGVVAGDVLLASITLGGSGTITPPAGWALVRSDVDGRNLRQSIFAKVATAAEPGQHVWTLGAASPGVGILAAYGGATLPAAASAGLVNNLGSTAITAPGLSNPAPMTLAVGVFGIATNAGVTPPSGMIEAAEMGASTGKTRVTAEFADDILEAAGDTGPRTATSTKAARSIGQILILAPAP
jgi:hypothetical protein